MNHAILLKADDWEGLFINGELVDEGHNLNEGTSRIEYFLEIAKQYDFDLVEMKELWIDEEDEEYLYDLGNFPENLSDLKGDYANKGKEGI